MVGHGYAAKMKGHLLPFTFAESKEACWYVLFPYLPQDFQDKYWKRLGPSKRAAKKLGYEIVAVNLVEIT